MAGSLRRKKRARAQSGKKTQKVGVTKNFAAGRTDVDVATVLLPGDAPTAPWNLERTLTQNYAASGLASDPNALVRGGRNDFMEAPDARGTAAERAVSNGDVTRSALGMARENGKADAKRLTPKQTRVVAALVEAHGDDVKAMALDRKRNALQHTEGQLKRLLESYHRWKDEREGGDGIVRVDFRAPKKARLMGRF